MPSEPRPANPPCSHEKWRAVYVHAAPLTELAACVCVSCVCVSGMCVSYVCVCELCVCVRVLRPAVLARWPNLYTNGSQHWADTETGFPANCSCGKQSWRRCTVLCWHPLHLYVNNNQERGDAQQTDSLPLMARLASVPVQVRGLQV